MPPLPIPWLRGRTLRVLPLSPAQRVVRVLQVTRANWKVSRDVRRPRQRDLRAAAFPAGGEGEFND